jgi:isopentenyl-diphosphate delta-isomerase type 2
MALPELSVREIDPSIVFLGRSLKMPLLISCMVGGTRASARINRDLARAAQEARVAIGLGSFRIALEDERLERRFDLRDEAPDVPILANLGATALSAYAPRRVSELARRIGSDALVVHLNTGQELFQREGDRDFSGLRAAVGRLIRESGMPVIVKETGFGIGPALARSLVEEGTSYVDLAGSGGTNWIEVEARRLPAGPLRDAASRFDRWGYPTALLLESMRESEVLRGRLIASGGISDGVEAAKAIAMGASLVGLAAPILRASLSRGAEGALGYLEGLRCGLVAAMCMTGSRDVAELARGIAWADPSFAQEAAALRACDSRASAR